MPHKTHVKKPEPLILPLTSVVRRHLDVIGSSRRLVLPCGSGHGQFHDQNICNSRSGRLRPPKSQKRGKGQRKGWRKGGGQEGLYAAITSPSLQDAAWSGISDEIARVT